MSLLLLVLLSLLLVELENKGEKAMISNPARKYHFRRDGSVMLSIEILRAGLGILAGLVTLLGPTWGVPSAVVKRN